MTIPVCAPTLAGNEFEYVKECLDSNWISSRGKFVDEFEDGFARFIGAKHAVTTTSGTTAIHLAMAALGMTRGDEIIVPSFTMIASVLPIIWQGAVPVLVDAEPDTWTMDTSQIEERVTEKTKAIMAVHIYGHPCDMEPIVEVAHKHGLHLIEDAAEAHGAEYKGKKAGTFGTVSCFSFYANKIITTGEGGMLLTDSEAISEKARLLKDLAFTKERRFLHEEVGYNYRMTNVQAAIGLAQLERIGDYVERRRSNARVYNSLLEDVEGMALPPEKSWAKNVYWMYTVLIDEVKFGRSRDEVARHLSEAGIETRPAFVPMHQQPVFRGMGLFAGERFPVSEELGETGLNLPSGSSLTEKDIHRVCARLLAS